MNDINAEIINKMTSIRRYSLVAIFAWTLLVICSLLWAHSQNEDEALLIGKNQSESFFEKDVLYRRWASRHGGVYAPVTESTQANPYLSHIVERDITTPSGKQLTLINPAYMTRQVFELAQEYKGTGRGHITSIKPIRPENAPEPWEKAALLEFERGATEVGQVTNIDGKSYYCYMKVLKVDKSCLKCHASQGYREGEVRGGLSVSVPMEPIYSVLNAKMRSIYLGHALVWLLILGFIEFGTRMMERSNSAIRKQSKLIKLEKERADQYLNIAQVILVAFDNQAKVTLLNRKGHEVLGYDDGELAGKDWFRICMPPEEYEQIFSAFNKIISGELENFSYVENHVLTKSGEKRLIAWQNTLVLGEDDGIIGVLSSGEDITERRLAEEEIHVQAKLLENELAERQIAQEALQEQTVLLEEEITERYRVEHDLAEREAMLTQILDTSSVAIFLVDNAGRIVHANACMTRMFGWSLEELLGKEYVDLVNPTEKETGRQKMLALLGSEIPFADSERCYLRADSSEFWGHLTGNRFYDTNGTSQGLLGVISDITKRKLLENQLRESQKMEAIGQLAGGIAHDFNNILTVIMGYCSIMDMDYELDDKQKKCIDQIQSASEKAAKLTRDLLAFSRKHVLDTKKTNLNDIARHVNKFLTRIIGEDINIKQKLCEAQLPVNVDSSQIEQVIINLAANARDAMAKGGTFSIETGSLIIDGEFEHTHGYAAQGHYAYIALSDTGTGMDEETCSKIFEPFFTTKDVGKGTGLGMSIVYGIIKQHNGFISVYSEPGQGTTFKVYLPFDLTEQSAAEPEKAKALPVGGTETILLAEDDISVRKLVTTILTTFGYEVIQAVDGQEAIDLYAANKDRIDMILMDMIMPKKNGKEAYEEISKLQSGVKVLYSSGYTADFIQDRGMSEEGVELLMKPVQPTELLRRVREMLDL